MELAIEMMSCLLHRRSIVQMLTLNKDYIPFNCDAKDPPSRLRLFARHLLYLFHKNLDCKLRDLYFNYQGLYNSNFLVLSLEGI